MGSQRPGCSPGRQLDRAAGAIASTYHVVDFVSIAHPARTQTPGKSNRCPSLSRCGLHACVLKSHGPKLSTASFPSACPPVLSRLSRPSISALAIYKDPSHPPPPPEHDLVLAKCSQNLRYALGPTTIISWNRANGMKASIGTATCLNLRLFASSAGCSAIDTNGGVRGPKYKHHATKPSCALTTDTLETIASRRTMQLSRRECGTVWM
jgi:hypothetical protein